MHISTKTIWIAVYQTLEKCQVNVGEGILLKELMRLWTDTRLRQSDLARALDTLVRTGAVQLEMDAQGPWVRLADASFIDNLPEEDLDSQVQSLGQLAWVRQNQNGSGHPDLGRRFSDAEMQYSWQKIANG